MEPRLLRRGNRGNGQQVAGSVRELQWSHAFSDVETPASGSDSAAGKYASMEPRLLRRGNNDSDPEKRAEAQASMEPRLLRRGNMDLDGSIWTILQDASMEPRLLRRGNRTTAINPGLPSTLQWSHAFSDVETNLHRHVLANHESLQWSHAFSDVETHGLSESALCMSRFNGATPSQTWKLRFAEPPFVLSRASMEPRLLRRGNVDRGTDTGGG